jgi:hypothetical protein
VRLSRFLKLLPLLVVVASLAGYFGTRYLSARSGGKLTGLSPAHTTRDFRAEEATLRLAPGWSWPTRPIRSKAPDGRSVMYEKGFGKQAADYYWYCSWATSAVDRAAAPSSRRIAVRRVLAIREKYFFTTALAAVSKPAFDRVLTSASRGDVRGLRRDVALNCPKPRERS